MTTEIENILNDIQQELLKANKLKAIELGIISGFSKIIGKEIDNIMENNEEEK